MELTVYSEASFTTSIDGKLCRFAGGEDALPHVDDHVLFVADGIGGCSSTRHRKFNTDLFDPDKQFETLFGGVLEEEADAFTREYLRRCFADFVGNQPYYDKQVAARRKSSFFGARILSTLLLHKLRSDADLHIYDGGIFDEYHHCGSAEKKEEYLQSKADMMGEYLHKKLIDVANKAGFAADKSSSSSIVMFGTTLCFTIFRENPEKKYVEALYFVAGDSRPYAMAKYNGRWGMFQTISDCEESDGSMTSCVCAEERVPIRFACAYRKFNTPCILFNASDGCFDSGGFISQLTYEKIIYDCILESASTEELSSRLTEFFSVYGRHDDCSTMAMRFFGFDSFETVKEWAAQRAADLEKRYLEEDPELLDHDYSAELDEFLAQNFSASFAPLVAAALNDSYIISAAGEMLTDADSPAYSDDFVAALKADKAANEKMIKNRDGIREILRANIFSASTEQMPNKSWEKAAARKQQIFENKIKQKQIIQELAETYAAVYAPLASISKYDPTSISTRDSSVCERFDAFIEEMEGVDFDKISGAPTLLKKYIEDLYRLLAALEKLENEEAAKSYENQRLAGILETNVEALLSGSRTVDTMDLLPADAKAIKIKLNAYFAAKQQQQDALAVMSDCVVACVEKNIQQLAVAVYTKALKVGKELEEAVQTIIKPLREQKEIMEAKKKHQSQMLAKYDKVYYDVINQNQRAGSNVTESEDADSDS